MSSRQALLRTHEDAPEPEHPSASVAVSLSPREREVLFLLASGLTTGQIALRLSTSERTVEKQIASARKKLSAATRERAIALALTQGLIRLEP